MLAGMLLTVAQVQAVDNTGTGGMIMYTDANGLNPANTPYLGGYVVHTFTNSGTFTPVSSGSVDVLVVGGGGGGGQRYAGGGGAGGLILTNAYPVKEDTSYPVIVGAGGAGAFSIDDEFKAGTPGSNSVFGAITAMGGGGGRTYSGIYNGAGGSGGGGAGGGSNSAGGTGISGQGRDGGSGNTGSLNGGGGGGEGGYPIF